MRVMVTHLSGELSGHRELFDEPVVSIGRGRSCHVKLGVNDTRASANHAELRLEQGQYVLVDSGSTNGTFVNGRRVGRVRIRSGEVVSFGYGGPQLLFEIFEQLPAERPSVAETHEFPLRFHYRRWLWGCAIGFLGLTVLAVLLNLVLVAIPSALASAATFFAGLAFSRVNVTVGPTGLEHEGLFRTSRVAWDEIVALETAHRHSGIFSGAVCIARGPKGEIRFAPADYVEGHLLARMIAEATGKEWT
jgi:pSer/pThr/pTyr-binding forkhead associated (FHA) protein